MSIDDAIKAFDFLAKFNGWAFTLLAVALGITLAFLLANITDKIFPEKSIKLWIIGITILFVWAMLLFMKLQADDNTQMLYKANNIRNYLIRNDNYKCDYTTLARQFDTSKVITAEKRQNIIDIVSKFPDVFVKTTLAYSQDKEGVKLVDKEVYTTMTEKLLPMFKETILYYMKQDQIDTMNFAEIQAKIDDRCDNYMLDMLIAKNPKLFTFIVARPHPYREPTRTGEKYINTTAHEVGGVPSLKINTDTMKMQVVKR